MNVYETPLFGTAQPDAQLPLLRCTNGVKFLIALNYSCVAILNGLAQLRPAKWCWAAS